MKVNKLHFNWHECGEHGDQWGEDYSVAEVGKNGCTEIKESIPRNIIDKHFFDIKFEDGAMERIFNPNRVFYVKNI